MATQYSSDRDSRYSGDRGPQPGISRNRSGAGGTRSGYSASRSSGHSSGRPAPSRSGSGRPSNGQRRPAPSGNRRPPSGGRRRPQRRKPKGRFFGFIALALVVVVILVIVLGSSGKDKGVAPTPAYTAAPVVEQPVEAPITEPVTGTDTTVAGFDPNTAPDDTTQTQYSSVAEMLNDEDADVQALDASQMAQVTDLNINQSLPTEWLNVLLLGTDERTLNESARTDTMIICSINRNTGEVKLTSIMRDLNVQLSDIGKYSGSYRINAASYFGGPKLLIRTLNDLLDLNIQDCVMVNFFGFSKIAQRLGGIDVDVSEAEKDIINKEIVKQAKAAYKAGIDESDQENVYLETCGPNTHLNGRQTLAYARIRKLDGGDYMRVKRQQIVLEKLLVKLKGLGPLELASIAAEMMDQVQTNMKIEDILQIATLVLGNGLSNIESMRIPVQGTYKEETRNDDPRLYDCDFDANARELYNFIYS